MQIVRSDVYSAYSVYARDKEFIFPISGLFLLFAMAGLCSFQIVTGVTCGSRRGFTDCVALNRCDGDINSHLQKHRLSRKCL